MIVKLRVSRGTYYTASPWVEFPVNYGTLPDTPYYAKSVAGLDDFSMELSSERHPMFRPGSAVTNMRIEPKTILATVGVSPQPLDQMFDSAAKIRTHLYGILAPSDLPVHVAIYSLEDEATSNMTIRSVTGYVEELEVQDYFSEESSLVATIFCPTGLFVER